MYSGVVHKRRHCVGVLGQSFGDDSTKTFIKSMTMGERGVKISVTSFMDDTQQQGKMSL